jgi:aminoglycoside phosphotransferase (APT) family kinase protein
VVDRSNGWPRVSTSDAVARLRAAGVSCSSAAEIEGGWASWTFLVDGGLIARFPRNAEIAAAHVRERALLPALAAHVSFRVPEPFDVDDVFVYERIDGRPLQVDDDIDAALAMIDELHTFPVEEAERLLRREPWEERLASDWAAFQDHVFPLLDDDLVAALDAVRAPAPAGPLTLVHADLGPVHVLVDEKTGGPVGIIDFEEADVGDPAMDLMPTMRLAGRPFTSTMWAFDVRAVLHDLRYFLAEGLTEEIPGTIDALRRRLDAGPRR